MFFYFLFSGAKNIDGDLDEDSAESPDLEQPANGIDVVETEIFVKSEPSIFSCDLYQC